MHEWMDGDFDRMVRWGRMFDAEPGMHRRGGVDRAVVDYIERAIGLRMSLLLRHVSEDDLHRIGPVSAREWQALTDCVRPLITAGTPPDAPAARGTPTIASTMPSTSGSPLSCSAAHGSAINVNWSPSSETKPPPTSQRRFGSRSSARRSARGSGDAAEEVEAEGVVVVSMAGIVQPDAT